MSKPDIILSKYVFVIFISFLVFLVISLIMIYLQLSAECSNPNYSSNPSSKKNKGKNITILLFVILACSMTAQAINQSYTRMK